MSEQRVAASSGSPRSTRDLAERSRRRAGGLGFQRGDLGGEEAREVDRLAVEQAADVGQAEPRRLERDDLIDAVQLARAVEAAAGCSAQRGHETARLIETQRPRGQAGAADDVGDVEGLFHDSGDSG